MSDKLNHHKLIIPDLFGFGFCPRPKNKDYSLQAIIKHLGAVISNLKTEEKIGVIDSQDALIGNPAYDLVSLVDDVRIKTSSKLKSQIYKYYLKKAKKIKKNKIEKFSEDFDILSVQRSLKIIGIFSRLFKRDKKKKYVKFIPYTWNLLEKRMSSKIFFELRKLLEKNISKSIRNKIIN